MALSAAGANGSRYWTRVPSSGSPTICRRLNESRRVEPVAPARRAVLKDLSAAGCDLHGEGSHAERPADLIGQVGLVHRVKMQMVDPVRDQIIALLGCVGWRVVGVVLL